MFTGIVMGRGEVVSVEATGGGRQLWIATALDLTDAVPGASIACDGVCLTATSVGAGWFTVDASEETLAKTTLGEWTKGRIVNLERALKVGDELGGHWVSGHVDGTATIEERRERDGSAEFVLSAPDDLMRFVAKKGSVTLDGVSLTVTSVDAERFGVSLIPHTMAVTGWGIAATGQRMNLEIDLMARYVARLKESA